MRTASPVLFPLFRSAHQAELLTAVFFAAPSDVLSLRSLSRDTGISYATVHREIGRLKDAGLVVDHRVGNTRVVRANDKSPYFEPLRTLLEVAFGAEPLLRERLARVPGVQAAALYGSYAARRSGQTGTSPVDIDVLVVGRPDMNVLYSECEEVARAVGREVNPTVVTADEWANPSSGFLRRVRNQPRIALFGDWGSMTSNGAEGRG